MSAERALSSQVNTLQSSVASWQQVAEARAARVEQLTEAVKQLQAHLEVCLPFQLLAGVCCSVAFFGCVLGCWNAHFPGV